MEKLMTEVESNFVSTIPSMYSINETYTKDDYKKFPKNTKYSSVFAWIFDEDEDMTYKLYCAIMYNDIPEQLGNVLFVEDEQIFIYIYS